MHPFDSTSYLAEWGMKLSNYQQSYQFDTCLLGLRTLINKLSMDLIAKNNCLNWRV
tara:strand:- start:523 stop:690 length:168 start_codon:yes stop_codon:yes gene_type:complete